MNKNEFMESLKAKLAGLNPEDREDAINYYWEYLEEAGFGEERRCSSEDYRGICICK